MAGYHEGGCRLLLAAVFAQAQYDFAFAVTRGLLTEDGKVTPKKPRRSHGVDLSKFEVRALSFQVRSNSWVHGAQTLANRPLTTPNGFRKDALQLRVGQSGRLKRFYIPSTRLQ